MVRPHPGRSERLLAERPAEFTETDRAFLEACRQAEEAWKKHKKDRFIIQVITGGVVGLIVVFLLILAWMRNEQAKTQQINDQKEGEGKRLTGVNEAHNQHLHAWQTRADDPKASVAHSIKSLELFIENAPEAVAQTQLLTRLLPQGLANRLMKTFGIAAEPGGYGRHTTAVAELALAGPYRRRTA